MSDGPARRDRRWVLVLFAGLLMTLAAAAVDGGGRHPSGGCGSRFLLLGGKLLVSQCRPVRAVFVGGGDPGQPVRGGGRGGWGGAGRRWGGGGPVAGAAGGP